MSNDWNARMLGWKRKLVEQVVYLVCEATNLRQPSINFKGCNEEKSWSELAHYHPDSNMICFSERQLNIQDFNTLKSTAIHEVVHALGLHDHGPEFTKLNVEISVKLARFNPGTVVSPLPKRRKRTTTKKNTLDTSPEAEYRRLIARLEEARSKEERMRLVKEIYELRSRHNLSAPEEDKKFDEVLNVIKDDSWADSEEWQKIVEKIYNDRDDSFGGYQRQFDDNGKEIGSGGLLKWIRKKLNMKS